jgi:methanogenic corrinoid protein MtbC1
MTIPEPIYLHYLSSLLEGDKKSCRSVINKLLNDDIDIKIIYKDIIQRSMIRIGQMWDKCRISIADEHVATEITKEMLTIINYQRANGNTNGKSIIITCVQKEYHELGPKLIADFFEFKGWNSTFVGPNTPPKEFMKLVEEKKPDLIGISNNFYLNVTKLFELLDMLKSHNPAQQIIIGGQGPATCYVDVISKYPDVRYLNSLDDIENFITESYN